MPIRAVLGDQHAAAVGQTCFRQGEVKNTYGTGNFMLMNTGRDIVPSNAGLLTTVCYAFGSEPPAYALEGSVAVTGAAVQWLRDQIGLIRSADEIESLARRVPDNGGVYFVPAFSGLFAPYWRSDARGVIVGLTRHSDRGHLARATLEAICFQTRDVLHAMERDSGIRLEVLKADGGATANDTLMQLQADILGVPVVRPRVLETTSLGAAYAAGLAVGMWSGLDELSGQVEGRSSLGAGVVRRPSRVVVSGVAAGGGAHVRPRVRPPARMPVQSANDAMAISSSSNISNTPTR